MNCICLMYGNGPIEKWNSMYIYHEITLQVANIHQNSNKKYIAHGRYNLRYYKYRKTNNFYLLF